MKAPLRCEEAQLRTIHLVKMGWHVDIVLNNADVRDHLPALGDDLVDAKFLQIGWGDNDFYRSKTITGWMTTKALLWPTASVLHVAGLPDSPDIYYREMEVIQVVVNDLEFRTLLDYINRTFETKGSELGLRLGDGLYGDSSFYAANGYYHAFNTCNKWTAKGLKTATNEVSTMFSLTADRVLQQAAKLEVREACINGERIMNPPHRRGAGNDSVLEEKG